MVRGRSRGRLDLVAYALSPDAHRAVTLLRVRDTGYWLDSLYEYGADGWAECTTGSAGTVWTSVGENEAGDVIGVLRQHGEAPEGAEAALYRWRGVDYEVPVHSGFFVFVVWDAPELLNYDPEFLGFR